MDDKELRLVVEEVCSGWEVYPVDGDNLYAPTGEEYIELVAGGLVPWDRMLSPEIGPRFTTIDECIIAYKDVLKKYLADKKGVVYWRLRPLLKCLHDGKFIIYSRLLVSDRLPFESHVRLRDVIGW